MEAKIKNQSDEQYIHDVYAGVLGKVIGVRHGADIEGWTYEQIFEKYGEIKGYIRNYQKHFAADDDTNGPVFFIRALEDYRHLESITSREMGFTWLNYVPDGRGFFWWGGYGVSSEHTAYENLKNGIHAPASGSAEQNGNRLAEQIGGQIFSEVWGLINPGNPQKAAEYAKKMSAVSHDREGINGGMFIAACTAAAFAEKDIIKILEAGLSVIPEASQYGKAIERVIYFYKRNPDNWRDCFYYISEHFGYRHFPGPVHIIPNAAIIALALLYGEGDFSNTINICNMCGWDTDCNVGNVGTIMGVRNGLAGIDLSWREPVNDFLCCSSVLGSLNMVDLPNFSLYLAAFCYEIKGIPFPENWGKRLPGSDLKYHFELPGSTHSIKAEFDTEINSCNIVNTNEKCRSGTRSLKAAWHTYVSGSSYCLFMKTYYAPEDFEDSRMDPSFSPILYPGQIFKSTLCIPQGDKIVCKVRMYFDERNQNKRFYGKEYLIDSGKWLEIEFKIPYMDSALIKKCGIEIIPSKSGDEEFVVFIDNIEITGKPDYSISFGKERLEEWNSAHIEISQMTILRGTWTLEEGKLCGRYHGRSAECFTGHRYWTDYQLKVSLQPVFGEDHFILFRVQGGIRSYGFGLAPNQTLAFYKKDEEGFHTLKTKPFSWKIDDLYELTVKCVGAHYGFYVNGDFQFCYSDEDIPYLDGAIGFANQNASRTNFVGYRVIGI